MKKIEDSFSPKPFVLDDMCAGFAKVYTPSRSVEVDNKDDRFCVCAHLCDLFLTYPVTDCGIRCIPKNARCKFGGKCHGSRILKNGKPTRKNVDLPYRYVRISRCSER